MSESGAVERPRRRRRWWILLLLVVGACGVLFLLGRRPPVPAGSVLVLDLREGVPERSEDGLMSFLGAPAPDLVDLSRAVLRAASDDRIVGILLRAEAGSVGAAQAEDLRGLVERFRRSRKFAVAHLGSPDTLTYYLATAADEVWMDSAGLFGAVGIHARAFFLKDCLSQVGLEADLVRVGDFKGAYEQLTLAAPTPEFETSMDAMVDSLYQSIVDGISSSRNLPAGEVRDLLDRSPMLPGEAIEEKLVDRKLGSADLQVHLDEKASRPVTLLPLRSYLESIGSDPASGQCLALVHVLGSILDGDSRTLPLTGEATGSESVARALKDAADDPEVVGILLRIDSPGGTVSASERIHGAVERARKQKPVVVSMGDTAASGGYYSACGADRIFAQRSTITGSIGVFGGKVVAGPLLDRLGVASRSYSRGRRAGMYDMTRPFSPDERIVLKEVFEGFYRRFVASVAAGRKKGFEEIDAVAQGRIWTGVAALEAGLVDAIGGLPEAMDALRELARVTGETPLKVVPPRSSIWDLFGKEDPGVVLSRSSVTDARAALVWLEETRFFDPFSALALSSIAVDVR